ncbi:hypothetical protein COU74_03455 [Candidatus Peregrinibacteria bacterium CG10_big_fil_rev_8_21_14_0_10_36_19]|nr:MAG: hypothetical protein COU74_03455 [Candidatus Peregrinibacteria bacterium CG10_big_fil_rev_8_21_14_0_10_36_19]
MTEATITIEDKGGLKIAHIGGQLDESNVDTKIQDIYKALESSQPGVKMIFDLENLEYMNSKSIGYLTDLYGKVTEKGGKVAISNAKPNIADILQVVGLTQLINTYETVQEAELAMNGSQQTAQPEAASAPTATPAPTAASMPQAVEQPIQTMPEAPVQAPASQAPAASPQVATPAPAEMPTMPIQAANEAPQVTPSVASSETVQAPMPTVEATPAQAPTPVSTPMPTAEPVPQTVEQPSPTMPQEPMQAPAPTPTESTEESSYKFE